MNAPPAGASAEPPSQLGKTRSSSQVGGIQTPDGKFEADGG